ncbi:Protein of unknown function [Bacillus wiedmannii]|nr:Protein of unknown function [Bacillus wiedmannii]
MYRNEWFTEPYGSIQTEGMTEIRS